LHVNHWPEDAGKGLIGGRVWPGTNPPSSNHDPTANGDYLPLHVTRVQGVVRTRSVDDFQVVWVDSEADISQSRHTFYLKVLDLGRTIKTRCRVSEQAFVKNILCRAAELLISNANLRPHCVCVIRAAIWIVVPIAVIRLAEKLNESTHYYIQLNFAEIDFIRRIDIERLAPELGFNIRTSHSDLKRFASARNIKPDNKIAERSY